MRFPRRKPKVVEWELKVTTPDGTMLNLTTRDLDAIWRFGNRSTDGFVDILLGLDRVHLWVKPAGWEEPDRTQMLDGTAALPDGMRRYW